MVNLFYLILFNKNIKKNKDQYFFAKYQKINIEFKFFFSIESSQLLQKVYEWKYMLS